MHWEIEDDNDFRDWWDDDWAWLDEIGTGQDFEAYKYLDYGWPNAECD